MHTVVVNAHGALMHLELKVREGQTVILQNPETSEQQTCRVIRVNTSVMLEGKAEVGIEFLRPEGGFSAGGLDAKGTGDNERHVLSGFGC